MALLERWRARRLERGKEKDLKYGTGKERYHLVLKVEGGTVASTKTYFLTTETNKKELSQPEANEIGYQLLQKKYGGSIFDVHVVSRYDRVTGKKG